MKKKIYIEHIIWEDHSGGSSAWTDVNDIKNEVNDEYYIHTVGMVVSENAKRLVIVQNLAKNMLANHHMTIIKNSIKKRHKIANIIERL